MQTKLLHAIISAVVIAIVLGFSLIPSIWQMISHEPTFGPAIDGITIIGVIASVAVVAVTLLSFKLLKNAEK